MQVANVQTPESSTTRLLAAEYSRGDLLINLTLDPDALTGTDLERIATPPTNRSGLARSLSELRAGAEVLAKIIKDWDAEDSEPTPEFLFSLPVPLISDLTKFCIAEICNYSEDLTQLRRYLLTGGVIGKAPEYYWEIHDAKLLGLKPWEIGEVPMHWRVKARIVEKAERQASAGRARKAGGTLVYLPEI